MDVTAIAASGMQTAIRQFTARASAVVEAGTLGSGGNLPGDIAGMLQAQASFRADVAVFHAGETMQKRLLDILV